MLHSVTLSFKDQTCFVRVLALHFSGMLKEGLWLLNRVLKGTSVAPTDFRLYGCSFGPKAVNSTPYRTMLQWRFSRHVVLPQYEYPTFDSGGGLLTRNYCYTSCTAKGNSQGTLTEYFVKFTYLYERSDFQIS